MAEVDDAAVGGDGRAALVRVRMILRWKNPPWPGSKQFPGNLVCRWQPEQVGKIRPQHHENAHPPVCHHLYRHYRLFR
ncbi:MAG: hypothetical protein ACM3WS_01720, partial [Bacillota bacterium]